MLKHWKFDKGSMRLSLLDQRYLPELTDWVCCKNSRDVVKAIRTMVVRGAPAIGVAAAWGCVLAAEEVKKYQDWRNRLATLLDELIKARPTAVNLAWAVNRMRQSLANVQNPEELLRIWTPLAGEIAREDEDICRQIGKWGEKLIQDGDTVLTHCNAGALATAGYGTALGVIRAAVEAGKRVKVIADETRPFFQGARLTAFELAEDHIPVTVACDNACAALMQKGLVQLVITGADRIATNGDTANKIGTFGVAIMARYFQLPFYIAAPLSTFDLEISSGEKIPIETRAAEEVSMLGDRILVPPGVPVYNFAFDVTPGELISGIITEKGIIRPPYSENIAKLFKTGAM